MNTKNKKVKLFVLTLIILYLTLLVYWMFFGFGRITYSNHLYNLIPFKSIIASFEIYIYYVKNVPEIANNEFWHFAVNVFGNIGVFIPFGILLTILFDSKFIKAFTVFEIGLLILEIMQFIKRRGVFDIDDIILNTLGFLLGYIVIKIANKLIKR